jgi:hypothetical protein
LHGLRFAGHAERVVAIGLVVGFASCVKMKTSPAHVIELRLPNALPVSGCQTSFAVSIVAMSAVITARV